jgi:hypothetical protein
VAAGRAGGSLRTRVMAAAALLVVLTSLVTAVLGTTLLRSYLMSRSDAQLRDFAKVASLIVERQQFQPGDSDRPEALPTQFLVEVIGAGGQISVAGGPLGAADGPRLSAAQLSDTGTPFTAASAGASGGSWRVLVQRLSGGGHLVMAYSLGSLDSTVTRLEVADGLAGAVAVVLLAGIGLPLVRASPRRWTGSRRRPRRSRAVTCPGASTIRPGTPRSGGWLKRWMGCWSASRPPTWRERTARRAPWSRRNACAASPRTPATNCVPR